MIKFKVVNFSTESRSHADSPDSPTETVTISSGQVVGYYGTQRTTFNKKLCSIWISHLDNFNFIALTLPFQFCNLSGLRV